MESPAVGAARDLGERLLRPEAERVDVEGVPRSHLDALGSAGLMDVVDLPAADAREVTALLAAADASTWFVWTQHHTPVRTVLRSPNQQLRDGWLSRLTSGVALAGVAYTHLRRPGPPAVTARREGDSWVLDGDIAWLTSWGLADVFLIGAQAGDDVVWVLADLHGHREAIAEPLQLAAMNGTATVRLRLSGLRVPDNDVVVVESLSEWRTQDAARTADVSAAVFGVTTEALARLRDRDEPAAAAAARSMQEQLNRLRTTAYALIDDVPAGDRVEERLAVRAAAHALACRATAALVAAGAGRSMLLDAPAQRLARVALFLMVQGQTAPVRAATLGALSAEPSGQ